MGEEAEETFHKLELNNSKIWKYKQISKGRNQKIFLIRASFPVGFLISFKKHHQEFL